MHRNVSLCIPRHHLRLSGGRLGQTHVLFQIHTSKHYNQQPANPHQIQIDRCFKKIDLTFENTTEAYRSKSNFDLIRGLFVLRLSSIDPLVQHNQTILKWLRKLGGRTLFRGLMRSTFYGHFVAGESKEEIQPVVEQMGKFGVKAILDYCVEADITAQEATVQEMEGCAPLESETDKVNPVFELVDGTRYQAHEEFADRREGVVSARVYFYEGEPECDAHAEVFLQSIDSVSQATKGTGFCAIKLTALGRPTLLLRLSEVIAQTQAFYKMLTGSSWENLVKSKISKEVFLQKLADFGVKVDTKAVQDWFSRADFDQDGFIDIYEWGRLLEENIKLGSLFQVVDLKTGTMAPLLPNLTLEENQQFLNMMNRLKKIAKHAMLRDVRVMVDAEQTYFQPAIARLTLELMRRYNKEKPIFFSTYQAYLKNSLLNLQLDLHIARREDFHFGAKLVRGAYMEQERSRAESVGYEDPINPTYESTTAMYTKLVETILDEYKSRGGDKVCAMCATHNEEAVRNTLVMMKDRSIGPLQKVVCFGQLYGMCDQVSNSLGQAGFSVYKYVPYGPIEEVLPYLSRRALENGSILSNNAKERQLMRKELWRRVSKGDWWHDPLKYIPQEETQNQAI